jgi:hypothetical protein
MTLRLENQTRLIEKIALEQLFIARPTIERHGTVERSGKR